MLVQLTSTTKIVQLVVNNIMVPARVWEGVTESGIACHAYITRIAVARDGDSAEFDRELLAQREPSPEIEAIPLRLTL